MAVFTPQIWVINITMSVSLLLLGNWRVVSPHLDGSQQPLFYYYFNFILIDGLTSVCLIYL